jgi:hypothetical protein
LSERWHALARWLLIASLPALALSSGACKYSRLFGDAGAGGSGASGGKAAPGAASQIYWLRNSPLLDESDKPIGTVRAPQLVQVDPKRRARSLPGAAQVIDGLLPASLFDAPKDDEGLALYAQKRADLHYESENGPVIGRIYPGAFVSVAPARPPAAPGYLEIALPAIRAPNAGQTQVVAIVEASALGTSPQPLQGPSAEGRLVRDFVMSSPLWAAEIAPDSVPPFASTLCGDIRVLALGERRTKISQYHAGVELIGWYDYLIDVDNYCPLHLCNQRFVVQRGQSLTLTGTGTTTADTTPIASPPEGFVHAELSDKDPLAERIKRRLPVYWLVKTKAHSARCSRWIFDGVTESKAESGTRKLEGRMRSDPIIVDGNKTLPSFELSYEPGNHERGGTLMLAGLNFNRQGAPPGAQVEGNSYRGMIAYSFVGTTKDALRMLDGVWSSNKVLVAWHPDDEEHWFLSAEACTAAANAAASALRADPERLPGHFHMDCFSELHQ